MVSFYTIEIARTFCRRSCCCCCCRYNRSGGGTDTSSAGVGDVELPAVPRQRVVDQMVDTGWIEKSTYFQHRRSCMA